MLKLTLDTNCIIALAEQREPEAICLRSLLALHSRGEIQTSLVATSASERQLRGPYLTNFSQFQTRLVQLGLDHLELLRPLAVFDVSYFDFALLAGDDDEMLLRQIHAALFPTHPFEWQETLRLAVPIANLTAVEHKWRNRLLDVHALWCHMHYHGDIFVTSDRNFPQKRAQLAHLGVPLIFTPCDAEAFVRR